ncbi:mitochondrial nicotinamide adenine dinucleotide transporter SLC25A51-like [Anthonomus grandis grandis]|uniref:mitochondrial nicotinamide adenine dinucleotide transporter SLC25A51-like n=1 Tax=Anthonomus grandis grandis TaxID=2921223 RepID=UPI0021663637|nr:mitochondrial nicotinamide adenine dinucleotide transporter SLC25A51-like [Anthonomus grandis grandis]
MKQEGIFYLYRGLLPPLCQRSMEISMMFGVYKTASIALQPLKLSECHEKVACSALAGTAESVLCPFERTMLLLIDSKHHKQFKNTWHAIFRVVKLYGTKELFRGYTSILLRNCCHNICFFMGKDEINRRIRGYENVPVAVQNVIVGSSVGVLLACLFFPLKVVKATMQEKLGGRFKTIKETAQEIYQVDRRGLRNFYRGFKLNILRYMLGWGILNLSYEFIRVRI